jgi:HK97 family phage major capsid protein
LDRSSSEFWTEEGASAQESQATFGRTRLEAKKLTIYTEAPNELVADAPAFNSFLAQAMPQTVAYFEDDAFINGSGVGEPLGVLNSAAAISPTRVASNTVSFLDVVNMYARMLPQSLNSAVWVCSPAVVPQLLAMVNDEGTNTASPSLWLTGGQLFGSPTMMLLGRPLIVSEKVPDLGTTGDLTFVDFGFYLIGDRQMMQATSSPHFKFRTDETAFKVVERVDGRPWLNSALTPRNGGDTLSPIVTLSATQT